MWGVGVEGRASVRRLHQLGVEPVLVDQHSGQLDDGTDLLGVDTEAGRRALLDADVVVKAPGISRYDDLVGELEAGGVEVAGGMGLWLAEADRERVLCITGTKGKSTTTAIAGGLARALGHRCFVGGNLGSPPWDPAADVDVDFWLIEVSSYQATDVQVGPKVVAVTSLSQDHLSWHAGSADTYYRDKLSLCTRPGVQTVVANGADPLVRAHSELLGQAVSWVDQPAGSWAMNLQLLGVHNLRNAAIARAALVALGVEEARDDAALAAAATAYEPLPSRLTRIGAIDGVDFVDDSLSTNVLPTLAAVQAFRGRRIALLLGGHERGIDYEPLADGLAGMGDRLLVLTMPDNGPRIAAAIKTHSGSSRVIETDGVEAATRRGFEWARPDGVVLLSPAAPSFGRYADYRARAEAFAAVMNDLDHGRSGC